MIAVFSFVLDQRLIAMPLSVPSSSTKYKIYGILAVRKNGSLAMIFCENSWAVFWTGWLIGVILQPVQRLLDSLKDHAHVAELVDAADSKSAIRKDVKVRFLSWALEYQCVIKTSFCWSFAFATIWN